MTKLVSDLMHRGLITCGKETSLGQVAVLLTQHHVHALVVVDRDRRPIGLMSDIDLLVVLIGGVLLLNLLTSSKSRAARHRQAEATPAANPGGMPAA